MSIIPVVCLVEVLVKFSPIVPKLYQNAAQWTENMGKGRIGRKPVKV
jgi:hypothetical protein